jgi:hypothetical protein
VRRLVLLILAGVAPLACTATEPEPESPTMNTRHLLLAASVLPVAWTATGGSISADGLYTAGGVPGNYTVTASAGTVKDTARVCVGAVVGINVTPSGDTLAVGDTLQVNAAVETSCAVADTSLTVTWFSANTAVATVVATGTQRGRVTAVAPGLTYVFGTWNSYRDSVLICVEGGGSDLVVTPSTLGVTVGATGTLSAAFGDCATSGAITWTSRATGTATATTPGTSSTITGVAAGNVYVVATSGALSDSALVSVVAAASGCSTGCWWVSPAGNDANAGTQAAPFKTLQKAANVVNAGDTVTVLPGTYTGGSTVVSVTRGGTLAAGYTTFRCSVTRACVVDGQSNASAEGWNIRASYVRVEGFEVKNLSAYGFVIYSSGTHHFEILKNNTHDIGRTCYTGSNGRTGASIGSATRNALFQHNKWSNIGRFAQGESGCSQPNEFYKNHDHGIYIADTDSVTVRADTFAAHERGWAIQRYKSGGWTTKRMVIEDNVFTGENPYRVGQIIVATSTQNALIDGNTFNDPQTAAVSITGGTHSGGAITNNTTNGAVTTSGSTAGWTLSGNTENP